MYHSPGDLGPEGAEGPSNPCRAIQSKCSSDMRGMHKVEDAFDAAFRLSVVQRDVRRFGEVDFGFPLLKRIELHKSKIPFIGCDSKLNEHATHSVAFVVYPSVCCRARERLTSHCTTAIVFFRNGGSNSINPHC